MSHGAASFTAPNGPVQNPYARGFSAGGSSSGCGTLIGNGEVDMGMGGDQGGSIRIVRTICFHIPKASFYTSRQHFAVWLASKPRLVSFLTQALCPRNAL